MLSAAIHLNTFGQIELQTFEKATISTGSTTTAWQTLDRNRFPDNFKAEALHAAKALVNIDEVLKSVTLHN